MNSTPPFAGLKIVEIATVLAMPTVGMFFAELGAEVFKIENPKTRGDVTRTWRSAHESPSSETSAYFACANFGKHSLALDLSKARDREKCEEKLRDADVVLLNLKPGDDSKFGLQISTLRARYPKLIIASLYGHSAQNARPAYDLLIQAESGFLAMNGSKDTAAKLPVALVDLLAAHQIKEAILIALLQRSQTGLGQSVSVTLFETAIASLANQATNALMTNVSPGRAGMLHPNIAPYGETIVCADGVTIVLAVGSDSQFAQLCSALACEGLKNDPKYRNNFTRVDNRVALARDLQTAAQRMTSTQLLEHQNKVPMSPIRSVSDALNTAEAQALTLKANGVSAVRTVAFVSDAFSPVKNLSAPPKLGEHNE